MDSRQDHEEWMALASIRHQRALEDAAIYRRLPRKQPNALSRRLRDDLGDWLIHAGQRIKTSTLAAETRPRPSLVQPHQ